MIKKLASLTIIILSLIGFLNLGSFLDISQNPTKTDLLVCLGGGDYKTRLDKTLEIYNSGLSKSKTILLTGYVNSKHEVNLGIIEDKRVSLIKQKSINNLKYLLIKNLKSTAEEVKYIKKYMLKNKITNVTFISDPPHSKRINILTKLLRIDGDEDFEYKISGANLKNWNKEFYYKDTNNLIYVNSEVIKLLYAIFVYGLLDSIGLAEVFENKYKDKIYETKIYLHNKLNSISFNPSK